MDERSVLEACQRYRLGRIRRRGLGRSGDQQGVGVGSSVEFFDFRPYVPGDDLRHVDWSVYARSGELTVRRYREEVAPRLHVLVDGSRSMGLADGRKPELARELAAFFLGAARATGSAAELRSLGEEVRLEPEPERLAFDAAACPSLAVAAALPQLPGQGLRVLISDFMSPQLSGAAVRRLADGAAALLVVRLLGPWEAAPPVGRLQILRDVETGEARPLVIGEAVRAAYLARLAEIRDGILAACRASDAVFVDVRADAPLDEVLRRDFVPGEAVVPR